MITPLLNTILIVIMFSFMIFIVVTMHKRNKHIITKKASVSDTAIESRNIYRLLFELALKIKANNIALFRFHNGGHYKNNFPMNKFTCIMEVRTGGLTKPMQDDYNGALVERYAESMSCLTYLDEYFVTDIEFCNDKKVQDDANKYGHKSIYLFLIRQLNGEPEAFIGVNYYALTKMSNEDKTEVRMLHNKILNGLNMVKQK